MTTKVIKLPLNSAVKQQLTSDTYSSTVDKSLSNLDILYTYFFRYPRLLAVDIGAVKNSQGFAIDYTASHTGVGAVITALFLAVSLVDVAQSYSNRQKEQDKKVNQYRNQLGIFLSPRIAPTAPPPTEDKRLNRREEINRVLENILQELREKAQAEKARGVAITEENAMALKYKSIAITEEGELCFVLNEPSKKRSSLGARIKNKLSTIAAVSWVTLGLASFAYWILWIGWGVMTGNFSPAGIGSTGMSGFIIPLAIGAMYPLLKIRNWWRNHHGATTAQVGPETIKTVDDAHLRLQAAADMAKLLRRVAYSRERARLAAELAVTVRPSIAISSAERLESDTKIHVLGKNKLEKTATTFLAVTIGSYIGAQYAAWIVTDVLRVAASVTYSAAFSLGVGLVFAVLSVAYGAYKAHQKYQEVAAHAAKIDGELKANTTSLEAAYRAKLSTIAQLQADIRRCTKDKQVHNWLNEQYRQSLSTRFVPVEAPPKVPKTVWAQLKAGASLTYAFLAGATGGAMIARIATIKGTAVFAAFTAASFSNPVTLGIIIAAGLIYGGFKAYLFYQGKKEARAKALLEQRQEKIACLRQQGELADMQIKVLENKLSSVRGVVSSNLTRSSSFQNLATVQQRLLFSHTQTHSLDDFDKPDNNAPSSVV